MSEQAINKPAAAPKTEPAVEADEVVEQIPEKEFDSLSADDQDAVLEHPNPEPGSEGAGVLARIKARIHKATEPKDPEPEPEAAPAATPDSGDLPIKGEEATPPAEKPPVDKALLAGKYKSVEDLENGHRELRAAFDRKVNLAKRVEELEAASAAPPAAEKPADPEPELDPLDPEKAKAHLDWQNRQLERRLDTMEQNLLQRVDKSIRAQPGVTAVEQFKTAHPEIPPSMFGAIADYGDTHGKTSLEDALPDFIKSFAGNGKTEKPTDPAPEGPAPPDAAANAAAIKAAASVPTNLSDVPSTPPGKKKVKAKDLSDDEFEALPEKEQDRILEEETA